MKISDLCDVGNMRNRRCLNGAPCTLIKDPDGRDTQCCLYCRRLEECLTREDRIGCSAVEALRGDGMSLIWLLAERRKECKAKPFKPVDNL